VALLVLAATALPAVAVAALVGAAALLAIAGHLAGSRRIAVAGIAILFAASLLMIVGGYLAYRDDPSDPRPCAQAGTC
jgi:hypothetical protein